MKGHSCNWHNYYIDENILAIKKSPTANMTVVHHDKIKSFYSMEPLTNKWVYKHSEQFKPAYTDRNVSATSTSNAKPVVSADTGKHTEIDLGSDGVRCFR